MSTGTSSTRSVERYAPYHDLTVVYEGQSQSVPVRVPDISTQGMFINTAAHFPEGAVLKVKFRLGDSNAEIQTRAEVRFCLPGVGIGVEFTGISEEDKQTIERHIASR